MAESNTLTFIMTMCDDRACETCEMYELERGRYRQFSTEPKPRFDYVRPRDSKKLKPQHDMKTGTKRTSIIVACSLAICALPAAFAGPGGDKHFKKMDTNADGKISRAEHAAGAKQMFTECDANRDGLVTATEMQTAIAAQGTKPGKHDKTAAQKIKEIDQNADGQLTVAEHEAGTEKMFGKMDKDGDGFLSKAECDAAEKKYKQDS